MDLQSSENLFRTETTPAEVVNPKYTYDSLPTARSIRLLRLTRSKSDTIHCALELVSLDEEPHYTALSYCWGSPKGTIPIECGDKRDILYVTPNLYSYLKQLCHGTKEDMPEYLWVDALCIDQEDDVEKGSQVSIMRDIYRQAEQVQIWLGEATEESDMAMDWMMRLNMDDLKAIYNDFSTFSTDSDEMKKKKREEYEAFNPSDPELDAVMALIHRPWFRRVWVIQELVMARKAYFVCGRRCLDPSRLYVIVIIVIYLDKWRIDDPVVKLERMTNLTNALNMIMWGKRPPRLLYALEMSKRFLATKPRDKIFALLGFVDERGYDNTILKPDYSVALHKVVSRCTFAIIRAERCLDALSCPRPRTALTIPSWVPDWTQHSNSSWLDPGIVSREFGAQNSWRASGDSRSNVRSNTDGKMLALNGFIVDQIEGVAAVLENLAEVGEAPNYRALLKQTETLLDWESFSRRSNEGIYGPTNETMVDVYKFLLTAGQESYGARIPRECFLEWEQHHLPRKMGRPDHLTEAEWITRLYLGEPLFTREKYARQLDLRIARCRRLVRTKGGYLGLAPEAAEVGNVVAICQGGSVPLILRSQGENFQLVGDAYIHGMMYGERYEESKCEIMWLS